MIRTSIVLSPRQNAAERLYLQANGLPVDVTSASQSVVMTSHRPTQLYVASRTGQRQAAVSLTAQTGIQGQHMQRLMDILERQGSDVLGRLFTDRELNGEWLVAIDENRLNAVLSERFQFYLFRGQRLRELRPVARLSVAGEPASAVSRTQAAVRTMNPPAQTSEALPAGQRAPSGAADTASPAGMFGTFGSTTASTADSAVASATAASAPSGVENPIMNLFRIEIRQGDQVLVLPRDLVPQTLQSEAEAVLQGMQQLPDRMSALVVRLRERGVTAPGNGWIAMQVLRTMTEYIVTDRPQRPWLANRRKSGAAEAVLGFSEEISSPDSVPSRSAASGGLRGIGRSARGATVATTGSAAAAGAAASTTTGTATGVAANVGAGGTGVSNSGSSGSGGSAGRFGAAGENRDFGEAAPFSRNLIRVAVLAVLLVIIAVVAFIVFRPNDKKPTATTVSTTTVMTTMTTTARPTPTMTPVPTTVATTAPPVTWYVIARRLNIRSEPATTSKLIRTLTVGQPVYFLEQTSKDWTKIQTPEGEIGYVYASYISKDKPAG